VSTVHPPFDIRIFHKECRSLAHAGYHVDLVVTHSRRETIDGVHIEPLPTAGGRIARMLIGSLRALFRALGTRASICHVHDPELVVVGLLLKLAGRKVVYDAHEDLPRQIMSKYWIRPGLRRFIAAVAECVEDFAARRFDAIVGATPTIAERFALLNPRTIIVNNYPLLSEMPEPTLGVVRDNAVCYIGAISPERGLREIVLALEHCDAELHLAGAFSPASFQAELEALPGWKKVRFHGYLDRAAIYRLLGRSRAGLLCLHPMPNHIHSQPIKLYEYLSAGLPVIASDFPSWRSFFADHACGVCVDPRDPQMVAGAIQGVLDDRAAAEAMGARGRAAILARFHWGHEEAKLIEMYRLLATA
jgi:glycosyltransferase involved in cell wall biosynthesis